MVDERYPDVDFTLFVDDLQTQTVGLNDVAIQPDRL